MTDSEPPGRQSILGGAVLFILLVSICNQALAQIVLDQGGILRAFHGEGWSMKSALSDELGRARLGLWVGCLSGLLNIVSTLVILGRLPGIHPEELGLTTRALWGNVLLGLVLAVIIVPGAYGIQALAMELLRLAGRPSQEHPFTRLGQSGLHPLEWGMLLFAAIVLAPIWEELYYRGLVQAAVLESHPTGGWLALGAAGVVTLLTRMDFLQAAFVTGWLAVTVEALPLVVLLALMGVYLALGRTPVWAGLFATAVLFAWVHVRVWPSPLALLWLSLGLGWLRWRGRSLVGCIVLHAVFNAVACVLLVVATP